jgi:hypothetical protein
MKYKLLFKTSKFSSINQVQRGLELQEGIDIMHVKNANSEGYYWLQNDILG